MSPLVSIVVDNFNYANFIAQCIDSALGQTYPRVEVIVVDDASTDTSRAIIRRYGDRVVALLREVNGGQGAAFNTGFRASHGDIVMFLDADDWLYPHAVERIVAEWEEGQSKTHFRLDLVDAKGVRIDTHPAPELRLDRGDVMPALFEFGRYETVVTSGNAFARAALQSCMPVPEEPFRIAADGYLSTVVPFHGPVSCIEECLGAYRVHGGNAYALAPTTADICRNIRKFLAHDAHKDRVLRDKAAASGLGIRGSPQLKDPLHLERRLASLRLDPATHPYRADSAWRLALRGIAACRRARFSWPRRAVLAGWFLAAGLLPHHLAQSAIQWKMQPTTRSARMQRHMLRIRHILG